MMEIQVTTKGEVTIPKPIRERFGNVPPMPPRSNWRRAWEYVTPLLAFPQAIRKMIYTINAVESLNRSLRKIIKTRGRFPTDEAALKLLYLAIRNALASTGRKDRRHDSADRLQRRSDTPSSYGIFWQRL
jgi:Transposase, Mutator family